MGELIGGSRDPVQPIANHVDVEKLSAIWSQLAEYRNYIAHVQMKKESIPASTLENFAQKDLIKSLEIIFPQYTGQVNSSNS